MRALLLLALTACVPSRSALFDPVRQSVHDRIGIRPDWRTGWERTPDVDRRVKKTLARPLTADDAAMLAVLNSPALQAAYAELSIMGGAFGSARTPRNPEVHAEIVFPLDGGDSHIELAAVQDVSQLLSLLPRTSGADAELRASRRESVAMTISLAARARTAFYEAAAAEQVLALHRSIFEAATASADFARQLHEAGNITDLDLSREELFAEEARLDVSDDEANMMAARERLNAVIGLSGAEATWTIARGALADPPTPLGDLSQLEREAISASLELEALRWRIEAAGQAIGVARMESFVPDLGVGVSAKREGEGWAVGPMVMFSIPLWDWGSGRRTAAWGKLRRWQHRYAAIGGEVRAAARAIHARLKAAHARAVRMRERILPLREHMAEQGVLEYNAMNLDAFELLVMRREHIATEVRYIDALRDFWLAKVELDQLRAGSLPAGWGGAVFDDENSEEARDERAH
jgi:cobalt-zinc-cadmium efflux system outer membrane protein